MSRPTFRRNGPRSLISYSRAPIPSDPRSLVFPHNFLLHSRSGLQCPWASRLHALKRLPCATCSRHACRTWPTSRRISWIEAAASGERHFVFWRPQILADQKNENVAIFDSVPYPLIELFARRELRGARESAIYPDHIWSRDHSWSLSILRQLSPNEYVGKTCIQAESRKANDRSAVWPWACSTQTVIIREGCLCRRRFMAFDHWSKIVPMRFL
jgi:hypothetical protein